MLPDFSGEGVVLWKLQFSGRTADLLQLMDENISNCDHDKVHVWRSEFLSR